MDYTIDSSYLLSSQIYSHFIGEAKVGQKKLWVHLLMKTGYTWTSIPEAIFIRATFVKSWPMPFRVHHMTGGVQTSTTIDGRNPAPPGMYKTLYIMMASTTFPSTGEGFLPSTVCFIWLVQKNLRTVAYIARILELSSILDEFWCEVLHLKLIFFISDKTSDTIPTTEWHPVILIVDLDSDFFLTCHRLFFRSRDISFIILGEVWSARMVKKLSDKKNSSGPHPFFNMKVKDSFFWHVFRWQ